MKALKFTEWFFFSLFFFHISSAFSFAQDFTIENFNSDITIAKDSSFIVKETIEVDFHRPRHGIYREIPFRYTNELGNTLRTPLDVVSVTDVSGKKWKYKVTAKGNVVNIRVGDAEKYVRGRQVYVITYSVKNALLFFDDHDELYWNVTGNEWQAPINKASARVALAAKDRGGELRAACYTGIPGSRESACGFETSRNIGEFFAKKRLGSGEGLTIAFGWEKGLVSPPSALKRFLWTLNLEENWVFLLPLFSAAFMINLWHRRGRDPFVRESVAVMYTPPLYGEKPLSPAEVGTLIDEKLDSRDITSTIVGLAVKGYIRIEEIRKEGLIFDSTDYFLAKLKDADPELGGFERELMQRLFSGSAQGTLVSEMKNSFYKNLDALKQALYGELVRKGYFLRSPEKVRNFYIVAAFFVAVFVAVSCGILFSLFSPEAGPKNVIAGFLTGLPVFALSRFMPAKTKSGAAALMDILGFQEFMNRAEKDKIERMGDKDLFSRFLPYAIALDVADNWAEAFEGIYQEPPQWYISPGGFRAFSPSGFSRSLSSATSTLATAMYSAPRGSGAGGGFGGGGSSGGGFGGGGGGSW